MCPKNSRARQAKLRDGKRLETDNGSDPLGQDRSQTHTHHVDGRPQHRTECRCPTVALNGERRFRRAETRLRVSGAAGEDGLPRLCLNRSIAMREPRTAGSVWVAGSGWRREMGELAKSLSSGPEGELPNGRTCRRQPHHRGDGHRPPRQAAAISAREREAHQWP
jgi:hypothetical protein